MRSRRDPLDDPFAAVRRCPRVLVYGTLKRGERNHPLIADADCHGRARSAPAFRLHRGELPAVERGGRARIEGDLFSLTGEQLGRVDQLERHPDWYARALIELEDGRDAWMYLHPIPADASQLRVVRDGVATWSGRRRMR